MWKIIITAVLCLSVLDLSTAQGYGDYRSGNCSTNVVNCDENARCEETDDHQSYTCKCVGEDVTGDGFKDGTGCTLPFQPCNKNSDCPQYGYCDTSSNKCKCSGGFQGDGRTCEDVNECLESPCDANAECANEPGSFTCTCNSDDGYKGDGFTCRLFCYNHHEICDWPRAKCNSENFCECVSGYRGQGYKEEGKGCTDIDECAEGLATDCSEFATCENTDGSYECKCLNGYTGDGKTCKALPKNCEEIPDVKHKKNYLIDPDFTGVANAFWVKCIVIGGDQWATTVVPVGNYPVAAPEIDTPLDIEYEASPEDIKALVNNSVFCSQKFSFSCTPGYSLFPDTTWKDVNGKVHDNWGSTLSGMCTCGELKLCDKACYCDGSQTDASTMDEARVVDKSNLPIMSIDFAQGQSDKGRVDVESLMCSSEPIEIPKDCHEAKFDYEYVENTPLHIDLDGQGGQDPFLVYCDMESYEHVGITQIPTSNGNPVPVTTAEGETILYTVSHMHMKALIQASFFCSQRVEFQCKSSKLGGADGGAVWVTGDMQKLDYFPGGAGKTDSCGCGATQSCDDKDVTCNCNIDDGVGRKDFGVIIDKSDLPVTKVTAQIGNSRSSTYVIGELKCSQKQFDMEPNCEKLHAIGVRESYTYLIDSDGTGGEDPWPAQCIFEEDPAQGKTVVHHDKEGDMAVDSTEVTITYLMANPGQIKALLARSTFCTQEISIDCKQFTVPVDPSTISWTGGSGTGNLDLSDYLDSCGANGDACKCKQNGQDSGVITDKAVLPVRELDFSALENGFGSGDSLTMNIGPMVCSEVFPTCKQLYEFVNSENALEGEATVVDGLYTVDPDGAGGEPAFTAQCTFPETVIPAEGKVGPKEGTPLEPISKCFDVGYASATGKPLTAAQVTAYAAASGGCSQSLSLQCKNAPVTNMVNFTTCDGKTQVGWAGSYGKPSCACGVNGNCDGGRRALCNCDRANSKAREDSGVITQADRLPVCQVCLSINPPANGKPWPTPAPSLSFSVGGLVCDRPSTGSGSCQEARRQTKMKGRKVDEQMVALTGEDGGALVPVGCKLFKKPPLGILTVKPEDPTIKRTEEDEPVDIVIKYITINITIVGQVMSNQKYCSQKIFLYCADQVTETFTGNYGWYGRDGSLNQEWTMLPADGEDVESNCESNPKLCTPCGNPKGFLVTRKHLLPVTRLVLPGSEIGVVVDNTECFDLYDSCQKIYDKNEKKVGYFGKGRYMIDPDKQGPLRPFRVLCEFDKKNDNAVTVVEVGGEWGSPEPIVGQEEESEDFDLDVEYAYATPDQINALASISKFCWQSVFFKCKNFPLLEDPTDPSTYYRLYSGKNATSFGTGQDVNFKGCACHKLGFCSTAMSCNCDAEGSKAVDQGAITDKSNLPLIGVHVAGRNDTESQARFIIGAVRCSAKSTALPKDCAEAFELVAKDGIEYSKTGEYLISPKPNKVQPFMVRCDFTTFPGQGVTVIRPHFPEENPLLTNASGQSTNVPYTGVDEDQMRELIKISAHCYQGVRFDCYKTALLSGGSYFQNEENSYPWKFWGGGAPGENGKVGTCACGDDEACGGLDSSQGQRTRPCNCDLVDEEKRRDAGVIDNKAALPVSLFHLGEVTETSQASLTVGDLYCSQEPLNLNECELGFHDCDPRAECHDMEEGYHCVCPEGWQGKGVVTDSSDALANGRVCIDDDECEIEKPCPYNAECHNLPGTFNCTCKEGYKSVSQTECEDIDECAEGTDDCGENAFCDNLIGSYRCICNKGFRGDGKECAPVGQCSCFGDPHCKSFDSRFLHFQGDCSYVMATDGCGGTTATFEVQVEMWRKGQDAAEFKYSWVKTVTVLVGGKTIRLEQGPRLVVDGQVVSQYIDSYRLRVVQINRRIHLTTISGLEVTWDGADRVSVVVPDSAVDKTCGLCGNYDGDADNDWVVGPACPEAGQQTDNYDLFGRSWVVKDVCTADCSTSEPPPPPEECEHETRAVVEEKCRNLVNSEQSAFKECLETRTPESLEDLEFSCVFDVCASSEELDVKVCRVAETIAKECAEVDRIPVRDWRASVDSCDEMTCPSGQTYSSCGPANPPTCVTKDDAASVTVCEEGCFCPDNLLTEGETCITEEQCGCFLDGNYIPTSETVILSDCSAEIRCDGLNETTSEPVECGTNEKCGNVDGVTDCHCIEGYVRVNGTCEEDSCAGVWCGENEKCHNSTCVCIDGFHEQCGECVDVDECENHQHTCIWRGQKCVNVPGTYRCDCEPGFTADGNRCKDDNECETLNAPCRENSECVNTPGGYVCECCAGYKHSANGHCVRDESKTEASEGRCCACQGAMCTKPGKVCGTDGTTYASYRALSIHACRVKDNNLKFNYMGECEESCHDIVCERNYQHCKASNDGVPMCKCPDCQNSSNTDEVCGSDGVTYAGVCKLKKAACEDGNQDLIRVESQGPCPE